MPRAHHATAAGDDSHSSHDSRPACAPAANGKAAQARGTLFGMAYPEMFVAPMRAELVRLGVPELKTAAEVDAAVKDTDGTLMILVNSVCGCAAGKARP